MTLSQLLGWAGLLAVGAFVVFAFRQGMGVKPDERQDSTPPFKPKDLDPWR